MSIRSLVVAVALAVAVAGAACAADLPGLGQKLNESDFANWDISIGPDGVGLPPGSGTALQGAPIFAEQCEMCHGKGGRGGAPGITGVPTLVAPCGGACPLAFADPSVAIHTIGNYEPYATTIWDFIRRAMPWQAPKTLKPDQIYALTAYILNQNNIIGENDVLDAQTLPKVKMPNRDGFINAYPVPPAADYVPPEFSQQPLKQK